MNGFSFFLYREIRFLYRSQSCVWYAIEAKKPQKWLKSNEKDQVRPVFNQLDIARSFTIISIQLKTIMNCNYHKFKQKTLVPIVFNCPVQCKCCVAYRLVRKGTQKRHCKCCYKWKMFTCNTTKYYCFCQKWWNNGFATDDERRQGERGSDDTMWKEHAASMLCCTEIMWLYLSVTFFVLRSETKREKEFFEFDVMLGVLSSTLG